MASRDIALMMGDTAANDAQPAGGRCHQASTTNQRRADLMQQHRDQVLRSHWQQELKAGKSRARQPIALGGEHGGAFAIG